MARKKAPEKAANHERWLVSYADFITLLFAVFVTLYAMSQSDKKKIDQVAASYRSAFGISSGAGSNSTNILKSSRQTPVPALDVIPVQPEKNKKLNEKGGEKSKAPNKSKKPVADSKDLQNIKASINVSLQPIEVDNYITTDVTSNGLVIRLYEEHFFEPSSATVKPEANTMLGKIARAISPFSNQIRIEGHTDNVAVATNLYRSNWELSSERAATILHNFLNNYELSPDNISIAGYGQYHPVASNDTEEGRKKNRRVDIIIVDAKVEAEMPK